MLSLTTSLFLFLLLFAAFSQAGSYTCNGELSLIDEHTIGESTVTVPTGKACKLILRRATLSELTFKTLVQGGLTIEADHVTCKPLRTATSCIVFDQIVSRVNIQMSNVHVVGAPSEWDQGNLNIIFFRNQVNAVSEISMRALTIQLGVMKATANFLHVWMVKFEQLVTGPSSSAPTATFTIRDCVVIGELHQPAAARHTIRLLHVGSTFSHMKSAVIANNTINVTAHGPKGCAATMAFVQSRVFMEHGSITVTGNQILGSYKTSSVSQPSPVDLVILAIGEGASAGASSRFHSLFVDDNIIAITSAQAPKAVLRVAVCRISVAITDPSRLWVARNAVSGNFSGGTVQIWLFKQMSFDIGGLSDSLSVVENRVEDFTVLVEGGLGKQARDVDISWASFDRYVTASSNGAILNISHNSISAGEIRTTSDGSASDPPKINVHGISTSSTAPLTGFGSVLFSDNTIEQVAIDSSGILMVMTVYVHSAITLNSSSSSSSSNRGQVRVNNNAIRQSTFSAPEHSVTVRLLFTGHDITCSSFELDGNRFANNSIDGRFARYEGIFFASAALKIDLDSTSAAAASSNRFSLRVTNFTLAAARFSSGMKTDDKTGVRLLEFEENVQLLSGGVSSSLPAVELTNCAVEIESASSAGKPFYVNQFVFVLALGTSTQPLEKLIVRGNRINIASSTGPGAGLAGFYSRDGLALRNTEGTIEVAENEIHVGNFSSTSAAGGTIQVRTFSVEKRIVGRLQRLEILNNTFGGIFSSSVASGGGGGGGGFSIARFDSDVEADAVLVRGNRAALSVSSDSDVTIRVVNFVGAVSANIFSAAQNEIAVNATARLSISISIVQAGKNISCDDFFRMRDNSWWQPQHQHSLESKEGSVEVFFFKGSFVSAGGQEGVKFLRNKLSGSKVTITAAKSVSVIPFSAAGAMATSNNNIIIFTDNVISRLNVQQQQSGSSASSDDDAVLIHIAQISHADSNLVEFSSSIVSYSTVHVTAAAVHVVLFAIASSLRLPGGSALLLRDNNINQLSVSSSGGYCFLAGVSFAASIAGLGRIEVDRLGLSGINVETAQHARVAGVATEETGMLNMQPQQDGKDSELTLRKIHIEGSVNHGAATSAANAVCGVKTLDLQIAAAAEGAPKFFSLLDCSIKLNGLVASGAGAEARVLLVDSPQGNFFGVDTFLVRGNVIRGSVFSADKAAVRFIDFSYASKLTCRIFIFSDNTLGGGGEAPGLNISAAEQAEFFGLYIRSLERSSGRFQTRKEASEQLDGTWTVTVANNSFVGCSVSSSTSAASFVAFFHRVFGNDGVAWRALVVTGNKVSGGVRAKTSASVILYFASNGAIFSDAMHFRNNSVAAVSAVAATRRIGMTALRLQSALFCQTMAVEDLTMRDITAESALGTTTAVVYLPTAARMSVSNPEVGVSLENLRLQNVHSLSVNADGGGVHVLGTALLQGAFDTMFLTVRSCHLDSIFRDNTDGVNLESLTVASILDVNASAGSSSSSSISTSPTFNITDSSVSNIPSGCATGTCSVLRLRGTHGRGSAPTLNLIGNDLTSTVLPVASFLVKLSDMPELIGRLVLDDNLIPDNPQGSILGGSDQSVDGTAILIRCNRWTNLLQKSFVQNVELTASSVVVVPCPRTPSLSRSLLATLPLTLTKNRTLTVLPPPPPTTTTTTTTTNVTAAANSTENATKTRTRPKFFEDEQELVPAPAIAGAAAVTGTSTAFTFFAAPGAASNMKAAAALGSLVTCGSAVAKMQEAALATGDEDLVKPVAEPLGWSDNLFGLELGAALVSYQGAVLSSILVLLVVLGGATLAAALLPRFKKDTTFRDGRRMFRVPGVLAIPASIVGPSLAFVGTVLIVHPRGSSVFGVLALLVCVVLLVYFTVAGVWFARKELLLEEPEKPSPEELGRRSTLLSLLLFSTVPVRDWKAGPVPEQLRLTSRHYGRVWVGAVDFAAAAIVSAIAGVAEGSCVTAACCRGCAIGSASVAITHLVVFMLFRPALIPLHRLYLPAMVLLSAVMSILAVTASFLDGSSPGVETIGTVASVIFYLLLVIALVSMAGKGFGNLVIVLAKGKVKWAVRLQQHKLQELARLQHQPIPRFDEDEDVQQRGTNMRRAFLEEAEAAEHSLGAVAMQERSTARTTRTSSSRQQQQRIQEEEEIEAPLLSARNNNISNNSGRSTRETGAGSGPVTARGLPLPAPPPHLRGSTIDAAGRVVIAAAAPPTQQQQVQPQQQQRSRRLGEVEAVVEEETDFSNAMQILSPRHQQRPRHAGSEHQRRNDQRQQEQDRDRDVDADRRARSRPRASSSRRRREEHDSREGEREHQHHHHRSRRQEDRHQQQQHSSSRPRVESSYRGDNRRSGGRATDRHHHHHDHHHRESNRHDSPRSSPRHHHRDHHDHQHRHDHRHSSTSRRRTHQNDDDDDDQDSDDAYFREYSRRQRGRERDVAAAPTAAAAAAAASSRRASPSRRDRERERDRNDQQQHRKHDGEKKQEKFKSVAELLAALDKVEKKMFPHLAAAKNGASPAAAASPSTRRASSPRRDRDREQQQQQRRERSSPSRRGQSNQRHSPGR